MRGSLRVFALLVVVTLLLAGAPIAPASATTPRSPQPAAIVATRAALTRPAPSPVASRAAARTEMSATPAQSGVPEPPAETTAAPTPTPSRVTPAASLYRISIPRLGIALFIKEGDIKRDIDDQRTPENYAFHLPGTAMPGQGGNTFLYAHARNGMFLSLWRARPGDEVLVVAPDGQLFLYVIREVLPRVAPSDVSSTRPTATERLTLQTSTGPNASDPRFVVFAFPHGG